MIIYERDPDPCIAFEKLPDGTMRPRYPNGHVPTQGEWKEIVAVTNKWYDNIDSGYITRVNQYLNRCYAEMQAAPIIAKAPDRSGWVYVLQAGPYYKIGKSKDVDRRIEQLATLPPFDIELVHTMPTDNMGAVEQDLHRLFNAKRVNGEWFELTEEDVAWLKTL